MELENNRVNARDNTERHYLDGKCVFCKLFALKPFLAVRSKWDLDKNNVGIYIIHHSRLHSLPKDLCKIRKSKENYPFLFQETCLWATTCLLTCGRTSWRACRDSPPTPTWGITTQNPSASSNHPKVTPTQFSQVIVDFGAQYVCSSSCFVTDLLFSLQVSTVTPPPAPSSLVTTCLTGGLSAAGSGWSSCWRCSVTAAWCSSSPSPATRWTCPGSWCATSPPPTSLWASISVSATHKSEILEWRRRFSGKLVTHPCNGF